MPETVDFGRYGLLAIGEAKYADMAPHHLPTPGQPGRYDGPYMKTYSAERESLLRRIFDDRDPTAKTEAPIVWRGADGETGSMFLLRSDGGVMDEIPIPIECVESFSADVTEGTDDNLRQVDFTAKIAGVAA